MVDGNKFPIGLVLQKKNTSPKANTRVNQRVFFPEAKPKGNLPVDGNDLLLSISLLATETI